MQQMYDLHPDAKIGKNVTISNFSTIYEDVVIGDNTWIGPNVTIFPGARIGKNCKIFPGASIAAVPQDLKFNGEYSTVEIGDNNVIRECVTISRGTAASGKTVIGNNNLLMAYVHIAHDCVVGNNCVFANNATLAGHIIVGDYVVLGGMTACLQFIHLGSHIITAGGSMVNKDIPPFIKAAHAPISFAGVNTLGLQRRGYTSEQVDLIRDIYRILFEHNLNTSMAVEEIKKQYGNTAEGKEVLDFISDAKTGILKGYKSVR